MALKAQTITSAKSKANQAEQTAPQTQSQAHSATQNPQTSETLQIISKRPESTTGDENADDEINIFEFLKSVFPTSSEKSLKMTRRDFYGDCKTLDEVKAHHRLREERQKKWAEEDKKNKSDEKKRRLQDLIKSARIPKIFSDIRAHNFTITEKNESAAKIAINSIKESTGLYIYGDCGTGKTMLASVIANERAELNKSSMFIGAVDVFHELNPFSSDSRTAAARKHLIKNAPCLIIDDLGAEKPSDWTKQTLFEIIDFRYRENLQTIFTSNFNIDELQSRLSEYEGKRIIRRIKSMCRLVELNHY